MANHLVLKALLDPVTNAVRLEPCRVWQRRPAYRF
jgi:hypothetical protein